MCPNNSWFSEMVHSGINSSMPSIEGTVNCYHLSLSLLFLHYYLVSSWSLMYWSSQQYLFVTWISLEGTDCPLRSSFSQMNFSTLSGLNFLVERTPWRISFVCSTLSFVSKRTHVQYNPLFFKLVQTGTLKFHQVLNSAQRYHLKIICMLAASQQ